LFSLITSVSFLGVWYKSVDRTTPDSLDSESRNGPETGDDALHEASDEACGVVSKEIYCMLHLDERHLPLDFHNLAGSSGAGDG
jgi:hypothetical protein